LPELRRRREELKKKGKEKEEKRERLKDRPQLDSLEA
jgi:hypothetical protein